MTTSFSMSTSNNAMPESRPADEVRRTKNGPRVENSAPRVNSTSLYGEVVVVSRGFPIVLYYCSMSSTGMLRLPPNVGVSMTPLNYVHKTGFTYLGLSV